MKIDNTVIKTSSILFFQKGHFIEELKRF